MQASLNIASGNTGEISRGLETGQLNLGFIRPVENIGSLRFVSLRSAAARQYEEHKG